MKQSKPRGKKSKPKPLNPSQRKKAREAILDVKFEQTLNFLSEESKESLRTIRAMDKFIGGRSKDSREKIEKLIDKLAVDRVKLMLLMKQFKKDYVGKRKGQKYWEKIFYLKAIREELKDSIRAAQVALRARERTSNKGVRRAARKIENELTASERKQLKAERKKKVMEKLYERK